METVNQGAGPAPPRSASQATGKELMMILRILVDNSTSRPELGFEHGLSVFVETPGRRILFDTGASDLYSRNAAAMGVDLTQVDLVVLSHGHYDHGGGLPSFLQLNRTAPVYIQESALGDPVTNDKGPWRYIGLAPDLKGSDRFIRLQGDTRIDDTLSILTDVAADRLNPPDNRVMYLQEANDWVRDPFHHEQNLILREGGRSLMITGCAHKGIVNILEAFKRSEGRYPDAVVGGFHLINDPWDAAMVQLVEEIGNYLQSTPTRYYTGHCTGDKAFAQLREQLGDQIQAIGSGLVLDLFP